MALTADWSPLGDVFFRKFDLCPMHWSDQVDLQKCVIAAAPFGGPIALIRDETKVQKISSVTNKPLIQIFTSAGKELALIRWNSGTILKIGWSNKWELLCVQDDGSVLIYNIFGIYKRTVTLGQEARDVRIIQCHIFNTSSGTTGIAVLTSSYRIFMLTNIDEPRIRRLAEVPGVEVPPSCWAVVSVHQSTHVLLAKEAKLYLLDQDLRCEELTVPISTPVDSYIEMAVSFNNKYLALFCSSGILWIGSSNLQEIYCEFDTKCQKRPQQLAWCSTVAVIGYWEDILLMIGPKKDWVKFTYDSAVHLVPEIDGMRIISGSTHEFLQRVPASVEEIYKIGSMSSGAMLFEASKEFQRGSQKADEYIRMIKDKLSHAVNQCINASGHEFEPENQKALLRAASFGKCFLEDQKSEFFVQMCQELRVLNAVRSENVGIPLTYQQLQHLQMPILIDRLLLRKLYWLAVHVCQYLKIPDIEGASRVLAHWACDKVQQSGIEEDQLARAIAEKLGDTPGVSYSEIANKAIECGKVDLAIRLLNFEPKAAEQVPLLLKMNRNQLALNKAIESGDTDLVYTVLLNLQERMARGEFLMSIRTVPIACSLFLQFCREHNRPMLLELYYQEDNFQEEGNTRIADSYEDERFEGRVNKLVATQDAFNKAKNDCAAKLTEEQIRLMKFQRKLEEETNKPFLDLSLHETMLKLIVENNQKAVEQLRKDFKVPDRRFWWMKIIALSETGDWNELDRFSKSKKSPIGYEPFVEVCVKNKNLEEAQKYMSRVTPENLVRCYVKLGKLEQAAESAFHSRNAEDLSFVFSKCPPSNRALLEKIQIMRNQLGTK